MSKVTVKNISNRRVGIYVPDLRINRVILPGREISMEESLLEDALTYPGVTELFSKKYLIVEEIKEGIELGVIDESSVVTTDGKTVVECNEYFEQLKTIIESGTDFQLKKIVSQSNKYRQEVIAAAAAQSSGITLNKIEIIKNLTGIDLNKIIKE